MQEKGSALAATTFPRFLSIYQASTVEPGTFGCSDMQMTPPYGRKWRGTKKPLDKSESGEWKSWLNPRFVAIHPVKGFGIFHKAEIDVLLEFTCFFEDPMDVGNLISGSCDFSKTSLNIWKSMVHILLKPGLENFEYYLLVCEMTAFVQ